jgi:hypothetical protein
MEVARGRDRGDSRCAGLGDQAHDRLTLLLIDLWVPNWSSTAVTCGIAEQ